MEDPYAGLPLWFGGESWAPITDGGTKIATPVGEKCLHCMEPVKEGEDGFVRPFLSAKGVTSQVPTHKECDFRAVMGGIGHYVNHEKYCAPGGLGPDAGLTKRESADLVWMMHTVGLAYTEAELDAAREAAREGGSES